MGPKAPRGVGAALAADVVDYYKLLGVAPTADTDTIRRAARAALKDYHPDRGGNAPGLQAVLRARDTLLDPSRRAHYDAALRGDAPAEAIWRLGGRSKARPEVPAGAPLAPTSERAAWALEQARLAWERVQRRGRLLRWTANVGLLLAVASATYAVLFASLLAAVLVAPFFVATVGCYRLAGRLARGRADI